MPNVERQRAAETIYQQAASLSGQDRAAFLEHACKGDEQLCAEVETLLRHRSHLQTAEIVRAAGLPQSMGNTSVPQVKIAGYELVKVIGEGGMGVVYQAEQDRPRRKVALKLIRAGLASPAMLRRFEYETDMLARLEHPGIARIYHAGIADAGHGPQPYFAMELIDGRPLDEHVAETRPSTQQRLELLIQICVAVHHAHTKGVIHRDLKPSNILITREGQPKILDFGVARAIDSDMQTTTLHTESGQLIGTLPYMAPEQASGQVNALDTSSDVYALGVVAYELLSGTMPYAVAGKPLLEAVRVICEQEPARLSSISKNLRGDVETIVQKAMEKEKTRRYQTAGELAADVKRFLDYEPITARPPSTWYQLAKFTRRNKVLVGAVCAVFGILLIAVTGITRALLIARAQRAEAVAANRNTRAVNDFLTNDIIGAADPAVTRGRPLTVREALDLAAAAIPKKFKDQPLTEAAVRDSIAVQYKLLGEPRQALPHSEKALDTRRRLLGLDHRDTIVAMDHHAVVVEALGSSADALPIFAEALERARRALGHDHEDTLTILNNYASALTRLSRFTEAEALLKQALDARSRTLGHDHPDTLDSLNEYASVMAQTGRYAEAEPLYRQVWELRQKTRGEDDPGAIFALSNYANVLLGLGRGAEAEPLYRKVLALNRRVHGENHRYTILSLSNLGNLLCELGQREESEQCSRLAAEKGRANLGKDDPGTWLYVANYAYVLRVLGKPAEAEPLCREAMENRLRLLGPDHSDTLGTQYDLALVLSHTNRNQEAEPFMRAALEGWRRMLGTDNSMAVGVLVDYAELLRQSRPPREVDSWSTDAAELSRRVLGPDDPRTWLALETRARNLDAQQRPAEAAPIWADLCDLAQKGGKKPANLAGSVTKYAQCLMKLARHEEAEAQLRIAHGWLVESGKTQGAVARTILGTLAEVCDKTNRPEEAARWRAELAALEASTRPGTQPASSPS